MTVVLLMGISCSGNALITGELLGGKPEMVAMTDSEYKQDLTLTDLHIPAVHYEYFKMILFIVNSEINIIILHSYWVIFYSPSIWSTEGNSRYS